MRFIPTASIWVYTKTDSSTVCGGFFCLGDLMKKNITQTQRMAGIAIFSALSVVVALVCKVIPPVGGFLSLDAKDSVIAIASFVYGPTSAVAIAFIAAFIEFIAFSTTGWYGFIMNFASSAVFSLCASIIYRKWRTLNGALAGFITAIASTTATMLVLNIFVTPVYMRSIGIPMDSAGVIAMIPKMLLPFNFAKTLLNSSIAMLIYKPMSLALKRMKLVQGKMQTKFNRNSVIILTVGGASLILSLVILFIIW